MSAPSFEQLLAKRKRQTCPHGHDQAIYGKVCQSSRGNRPYYVACGECTRLLKERLRRAAIPVGFVAAGATVSDIAHRRRVATKLERYGPSQMSEDGRSRQRAAVRRTVQAHPFFVERRTARFCVRNHPFDEQNTRIDGKGHRQCRRCAIIRQKQRKQQIRRPEWIQAGTAKVSLRAHDAYYLKTAARFRQQMIDAHPDKGGTSAKFIKASKALKGFLASEAEWYAAVNLQPPTKADQRTPDRRLRSMDGRFMRKPSAIRTAA